MTIYLQSNHCRSSGITNIKHINIVFSHLYIEMNDALYRKPKTKVYCGDGHKSQSAFCMKISTVSANIRP